MAESLAVMSRLFPALLLAAATGDGAPLQWREAAGFRWAALEVREGKTGFTLIKPGESQILWTNHITEQTVARHYNMVSGGGVAAGDFDGDGVCDLYFCNRGGKNGLFRNLDGWKFANVTEAAGVACAERSSTGAT